LIPIKNIFKRGSEKNISLTLSLKKIIGFKPGKCVYYEKAFTHRSTNRIDELGNPISYERLEFLGDSVLSAVIAHYLFDKTPGEDEGYLTKMRSKVVSKLKTNESNEYKMKLLILKKFSFLQIFLTSFELH